MIEALGPRCLTALLVLASGLTACDLPGRLLPPPSSPSQVLRLDAETQLRQGSLRRGAVVAAITHPLDSDVAGRPFMESQVRVSVDGVTVGLMHGARVPAERTPWSLLQIAELDRSNPYPEVLLASFTAGAHCCTEIRVLSSDRTGRRWQLASLGPFDGGPHPAKDPLRSGTALITGIDNRFLDPLDGDAASVAPRRFWQLQGSRFVDVTHQPRFLPLHRQHLQELEAQFRSFSAPQVSNGFLAGDVATAALVGEFDAAWQAMLARYDRHSDWGLRQCIAGYDDQGLCREPELVAADFPSALAAFLVETGYRSVSPR